MDSIEDLTTDDALVDIMVNTRKTIMKCKKQPDEISVHESSRNLENANLTTVTINDRLTFMSNNNRITNQLISRKNSYLVTNKVFDPKENTENQISTDAETHKPKKNT